MKQGSKLYTTLSKQGAPKCALRANLLEIGDSEECVHKSLAVQRNSCIGVAAISGT
jgi:hypothetical protein